MKGARAERELIHFFLEKGFSVIRAAGSGVGSPSPDLLAFKRGEQFAFECKSWNSSSLSLAKEQFNALKQWEENTGITTFVAWKVPREGWRFIKLSEVNETGKAFSITLKQALIIDRKLTENLR